MTFNRNYCLKSVQKARAHARIILITGLRRSGKSTLIHEILKNVRNEKPPLRIVHLLDRNSVTSARQLLNEARSLGVGNSALFIDNGDAIEGLVEAIGEITRKYATTIFLTGKRTQILEEILIPAFSPKIARVTIPPFSYNEFLEYKNIEDSRKSFDTYAKTGGIPELISIDPEQTYFSRLITTEADSFILTEILEPNSLRNPSHIRKLLEILCQATGETLPAREICTAFAADNITISPQAALDYLAACQYSGIVISIPVWDISRKKLLDTGGVWYFSNTGLRQAFAKTSGRTDYDRIQETLVCMYLIDMKWTVYQGRIDAQKGDKDIITFVCEKKGKRIYLQMIGTETSENIRSRKRKALLRIRDAWPKYLVEGENEGTSSDGIRSLHIRTLLTSGILEKELFENSVSPLHSS